MNICGVLVHVRPGRQQEVTAAVLGLGGTEVHAASEDGRLVVTVEDRDEAMTGETVLRLHRLPHVLSAAIVYHHFEPEPEAGPANQKG